MKNTRNFHRTIFTAFTALSLLFATNAEAKDIPRDQVPAPVLAAFDKAFANAMDVEWNLKGTQYKVEFETGILFTDHEAWYDASGTLLRHEEEIADSDLPAAVQASIAKEFAGHKIDDAERITINGVVSYSVELKGAGPEWDVAYDGKGTQLEKKAD